MDFLGLLHSVVRRALIRRGAESHLQHVAGHAVHFYRLRGKGKGAPVVLVHGLGGNANGFGRLLLGLAARFPAVYALDLPGNGFSPLPASGPLALEEHLPVLHTFCRQVVGDSALWVGNSLGGALVLTLAARFPEDVCAVGLLAPAGARVPPQRFSEMMRHLDVRTSWEGLAFTRRLFHRMPATALLFASQMAKVHSAPAVRAIRAEARVGDFLLPETLARVQMPTLLLWGASEKLLPGEMLAYFRRYLPPSARIEVVQGVGHVPQLERPREVVRRLTEFAEQAGVLTRTKPGARSVAQTPSAGTRAARPLGS